MRIPKLIILLISICLIVSPLYAATYYVRDDAEDDAGDGSANDVANAFSLEAWETHLEATAAAGDIYYVREGTYTLNADTAINTARSGDDETGWISIIGFDDANDADPTAGVDLGDWSNAPLIAASSNAFTFNDFMRIENLDITITENSGLHVDIGSFIRNVRINQSNGANREGISTDYRTTVMQCDVQAANSRAIVAQYEGRYLWNYIHDSYIGLQIDHNSNVIAFNIFDTCSYQGAVIGGTRINNLFLHNTFYGANDADAVAIYKDGTVGYDRIFGNIFQDWYDGVNQSTAPVTSNMDYNSYYSNSNSDVVNWTKGSNAQTNVDAGFDDAAGGDFDIGSNLDDDGAKIYGDSSSGTHLEIGAIQYEETAGGGGGGYGLGWINQ